MGALLVLGDGPDVLAICCGGFLLDAPYSPQRLSELAKMDGAIILSADGSRIARANVHLVPDPTVPTSETGTRHRTAERVARSLQVPVVSVSEEMGVINVYAGGAKHQLQDISPPARPGQPGAADARALQGPPRRRASANLTGARGRGRRHRCATSPPSSSAARWCTASATEIETMIIELGVDARLLRLQLDELYGEIDDEIELVVADYPTITGNYAGSGLDGDAVASPRGLRLLARVPRMTPALATAVVERFGELAKLQRATRRRPRRRARHRARSRRSAIKDTLDRLTESSILDQYH